jgi:hypothetical protein
MVRRMSPTLDLLKRASWRAEVLFKQRGSFRTIVWLTEDAGGHRAQFETACSAPVRISNDEVLSALAAEMAADFRRDAVGVVRFAVAYPARIITISTMLGGERLRRQVQIVAVEAHDDCGAHLRGPPPAARHIAAGAVKRQSDRVLKDNLPPHANGDLGAAAAQERGGAPPHSRRSFLI